MVAGLTNVIIAVAAGAGEAPRATTGGTPRATAGGTPRATAGGTPRATAPGEYVGNISYIC